MTTKVQIKWKRWTQILSSLNRLEYATLKQIQRLHNLKSYENAYRVLRMMEKEGVITSEKRDKKIYYLTQKGKDVVGSDKQTPSKRMIEHTLMRNDLFIYLGCPGDWKTEAKTSTPTLEIISDARFSKKGQKYFVEVDREVPMTENRKKIKKYKELNEIFKRNYNRDIHLIFYTSSESRKGQLLKLLKESVPSQVYSIFDIM